MDQFQQFKTEQEQWALFLACMPCDPHSLPWSQLCRPWDPMEKIVGFLFLHAFLERASEIIIETGSPHLKVFHTANGRTYPILPHLSGGLAPGVASTLETMFGLLVPKELTWTQWLRAHFGRRCPEELVERADFKDGESLLRHVVDGPIKYAASVLHEGDIVLGMMRTTLDEETKSYKIFVDYGEEQQSSCSDSSENR